VGIGAEGVGLGIVVGVKVGVVVGVFVGNSGVVVGNGVFVAVAVGIIGEATVRVVKSEQAKIGKPPPLERKTSADIVVVPSI
jgi:hypothetical protein